MSRYPKADIDGKLEGRILAPHLADEQSPNGLGVLATEFNPEILETNFLFSSALAGALEHYKFIIFPKLNPEQREQLLGEDFGGWEWGQAGTAPSVSLPSTHFGHSAAFFCQEEPGRGHPPRSLAVMTFKQGYQSFLKVYDAMIAQRPEGLRISPMKARYDRRNLTEKSGEGAFLESLGMGNILNGLPSGLYGQMGGPSTWCTPAFERELVKRFHAEIGLGSDAPKAAVRQLEAGDLIAVSRSAFHFNGAGDPRTGFLRFTPLVDWDEESEEEF